MQFNHDLGADSIRGVSATIHDPYKDLRKIQI